TRPMLCRRPLFSSENSFCYLLLPDLSAPFLHKFFLLFQSFYFQREYPLKCFSYQIRFGCLLIIALFAIVIQFFFAHGQFTRIVIDPMEKILFNGITPITVYFTR